MDEVNRVMKNSFITSFIILVYGVVIREQMVYIGMLLGSLVSILGFYMICLDVKSIVDFGGSYKAGITGYLKRYGLYAVAIAGSAYFFGTGMMLSTTIGLLNIKFNIYVMVLYKRIKKFKKQYLN